MITQEDWRCVSMATGALCVMMGGQTLMLAPSVVYWALMTHNVSYLQHAVLHDSVYTCMR